MSIKPLRRTPRLGHGDAMWRPQRGRRLPVACAGPQALAHHGGGGVLPAVCHLLPHVPLLRLAGPGAQDVHALLHLGPAGGRARERGQVSGGQAFPRGPVGPGRPRSERWLARRPGRPLSDCPGRFSPTRTQSCLSFIDTRSYSSGRSQLKTRHTRPPRPANRPACRAQVLGEVWSGQVVTVRRPGCGRR